MDLWYVVIADINQIRRNDETYSRHNYGGLVGGVYNMYLCET